MKQQQETAEYPMRINKYLAHKQYSTRKEADKIIEKGLVFINDRRAVLGDKVSEHDKVEVKFRGKIKEYSYYAYNKPVGIVTHSPGRGETDIKQSIPIKNVFPIGRLDKESSGIIILTNDGRITDRLLNPDYVHEKEYLVTTKEKLRSSFKEKMEAGVKIEKEVTKPCKVTILKDNCFKIVITEGKRHQIRRMCVALFQEVKTLQRVRIMNIQLGKMAPNSCRKIVGEELEIFLNSLGITN